MLTTDHLLTTGRVVTTLRGLLVLAFVAILVLQVMSVPGTLAYQAEQDPGFATERWILLVVLELELLCAQVVIVVHLAAARDGPDRPDLHRRGLPLGRPDPRRHRGRLAGVARLRHPVLATSDDPGNPLAVGILGLAITVVGLLMLVMRALLRQATTLHTDMEAVI